MSVLEEWVTVILYISAGILAPKVDQTQEQSTGMTSSGRSGKFIFASDILKSIYNEYEIQNLIGSGVS